MKPKGWGIKKFEYQTIDNFLAAHENVRQLGRVFERGINNLFQSSHLIPYNTVRKDMPPKGRNKHPLGIWYIFGTER